MADRTTSQGLEVYQSGDPGWVINKGMPTADSVDAAIARATAPLWPAAHAGSHATNGSDPITPASIGAMPETWRPTWGQVTGKPSTFSPTGHASRHATGGSDPITPASIGAMPDTYRPTWGQVTGKPSSYWPSGHAGSHAPGGSDPLTGYAPAVSMEIAATNLDTLTAPGDYVQLLSANGTLAQNYPMDGFAGHVEVLTNSYMTLQRATHYATTGPALSWQRTLYQSSWSPWRQYIFADNPLMRDTGWRSLPLGPGASGGRILARRIGIDVHFKFESVVSVGTLTSDRLMTGAGMDGLTPHDNSTGATTSVFVPWTAFVNGFTNLVHGYVYRYGVVLNTSTVAGDVIDGQAHWVTDDAWPNPLPGTPA